MLSYSNSLMTKASVTKLLYPVSPVSVNQLMSLFGRCKFTTNFNCDETDISPQGPRVAEWFGPWPDKSPWAIPPDKSLSDNLPQTIPNPDNSPARRIPVERVRVKFRVGDNCARGNCPGWELCPGGNYLKGELSI